MMADTIDTFLSSFGEDLGRSDRFDVLIPLPTALSGKFIDSSRFLALRCEAAQLPGRHLSVIEQKTYGPYEKFAYHTSYSDIDLTFIVDGDMRIKYFFDAWIDYINPSSTFNIEYKDNYVSDIKIIQYDVTNKPAYSVTLKDAYPMNSNQLDLNWGSESIHKLSVTFAYTYWTNDQQSDIISPPTTDGSTASDVQGSPTSTADA